MFSLSSITYKRCESILERRKTILSIALALCIIGILGLTKTLTIPKGVNIGFIATSGLTISVMIASACRKPSPPAPPKKRTGRRKVTQMTLKLHSAEMDGSFHYTHNKTLTRAFADMNFDEEPAGDQ